MGTGRELIIELLELPIRTVIEMHNQINQFGRVCGDWWKHSNQKPLSHCISLSGYAECNATNYDDLKSIYDVQCSWSEHLNGNSKHSRKFIVLAHVCYSNNISTKNKKTNMNQISTKHSICCNIWSKAIYVAVCWNTLLRHEMRTVSK